MTKRYKFIKKGRFYGSGKDRRYDLSGLKKNTLKSDFPAYDTFYNASELITKYQEFNNLNDYEKETIKNFLLQQEPESMTVYRGQKTSKEIRKTPFFSCSKEKSEAKLFTSGKNACCLFTIHLVDTQLIDINRFLKAWTGFSLMNDEKEILVLGGGTFYKNVEMTEEGFTELNKKSNDFEPVDEFECWYKSNEANV